MKKKKTAVFCSDRTSEEYLDVNSCGIEIINKKDRGSFRPEGRKDYQLIYVERGICNLCLDGEWYSLPQGNVILFRPGEIQQYFYKKEDNSISHYVHFTGVGCEGLLKRLGIYDVKVFYIGKSRSLEEESEQMVREFAMRKPLYREWCTAHLYKMLNIIARKYALRQVNVNLKSESRINSACKRIYENVKEPPTAKELASECCLSESRFLHLFREVTDKSFTGFVTALRIERAKELLALSDIPISEVAENVGFADHNYFSRCFKKNEGISPVEYRKTESEK